MSAFDLGLAGKTALVCGSSSGLGFACAEALATAGANVTLNGRDEARVSASAAKLAERAEGTVSYIVGDITTGAGREAALLACPTPDILVNNSAGPPPGDFRQFDEGVWREALERTMIAPIMLIRAVIDGMIQRRWGRIINITSSAVRSPLPLLGLSNGARSGLTGFVAGLAREVADTGVTINNLLPGRIETERLAQYVDSLSRNGGTTAEETRAELMDANPMKRFGNPAEFGAFCAFLSSHQAAYVTGQNILIDGGEFPGA